MQAKSVLYAAVGAPVVAAKKVGAQVSTLKDRVSNETNNYTEVANKAIDGWAVEGEKVVAKISDGKVVDQVASKVDLDQAKEQVTKLRDQLEDMLATWRHSFRPEGTEAKSEKTAPATKPAAKKTAAKPAAKKPAVKKPAAKKPAAKTSTAKSTTAASKSTTAKKPASAKTTTTKSTAAKAKTS